MKKIIIIPVVLTLFVMFYGTIEYNVDCPTALYSPIDNENCMYIKHSLWNGVALLSLTTFGLPPDGILTDVAVNADEAEGRNFIPMLSLTVIAAILIKRNELKHRRLLEESK